MLLELDLGISVGNNKTNEIEEFTNELNKVLQEDKILKIAEFIKKSINKFKQK